MIRAMIIEGFEKIISDWHRLNASVHAPYLWGAIVCCLLILAGLYYAAYAKERLHVRLKKPIVESESVSSL